MDIDDYGGTRRIHRNGNLLGNSDTLPVGGVGAWERNRSLPRLGPHALQSVDVLLEARSDVVPQRIEHDIQTFAKAKFRCGYKISVPGDQHNPLDQSLVSKRGDVDAELDIDAFLSRVVHDVMFGELIDRDSRFNSLFVASALSSH